MDCTDYGGVILILWNDSITFYGTDIECVLVPVCHVSVVGTLTGEELKECNGYVQCVTSMHMLESECRPYPLHYIEVTYMCIGRRICCR